MLFRIHFQDPLTGLGTGFGAASADVFLTESLRSSFHSGQRPPRSVYQVWDRHPPLILICCSPPTEAGVISPPDIFSEIISYNSVTTWQHFRIIYRLYFSYRSRQSEYNVFNLGNFIISPAIYGQNGGTAKTLCRYQRCFLY